MKIMMLCALLALLCGCASPVWETVSDDVPQEEAIAVWQEEAYTITLGLPQEAILQEADAGRSRYRVAETGLEIMTEVFLSSDLHSALRHVSGQDADSLTVLETTRFSLPEYQFAWYEAETGQLCRADLVMDGMTCYAVVCATPEDAGDSLLGEVRAVLAPFGLSGDEGV